MLLTLGDIAVVSLFSFCALSTLAYNAGVRNRMFDVLVGFGLLPRWTFFAPVPATSNLYVMYRDIYRDARCTAWRMLSEMDEFRSPLSFVWNPRKRFRKALHDLITSFPYDSVQSRPELVKLSRPYLLIVHYISSFPRLPGAIATQFLIMEDQRGARARVVFSSEPHGL